MKSSVGLALLFVGMVAAGSVAAWVMGLLSGAPPVVAVLVCFVVGFAAVALVGTVAWRLAHWLEGP